MDPMIRCPQSARRAATLGLLLVAGCLVVPANAMSLAAAPVTWDFRTTGGSYGWTSSNDYGNWRTFTEDGQKVRITGWADTGADSSLTAAFLGRYSTGLGVCNPGEGAIKACADGSIEHQADNVSAQDLVLFRFDTPYAIQSIVIDPWGTWDRDVSYWVGTLAPEETLAGKTFADLASFTFFGVSLNEPGEDRLTIDLQGLVGNALIIAPRFPNDGSPDRFKIRSLTAIETVVPVPAAALLFASALAPLALGLRRR